jgi:hypothetical protein
MQASLQVCIKAVVEGFEDAYEFLKNNSLVLKEAFECNQMLLQPVSLDEQNNSEGGARIAWCESDFRECAYFQCSCQAV